MKTLALILVMLFPILASARSSTPAEIRAELATRTYKTQPMPDGSTAVWEHRPGLVRRVAPENHSYTRWLATGRKADVLPAQQPAPKPQITADQFRAMVRDAVAQLRDLLLECQAEVAAADALGSSVAPDCTPVAEAWQVGREQAEEVLRGRYEVVR